MAPPPLADPQSDEIVEYRSSADEAWYDVELCSDDKHQQLTIQYLKLSRSFDELHTPTEFDSVDDVNRFRDRFRPSSVQVQDGECGKVVPGMKVCASSCFGVNELRYYDAVVEQVDHKEHSFDKEEEEEEQCKCSFVLKWQQGPNAGKTTAVAIENVCFLRDGVIDQKLVDFVKLCRRTVMESSKNSAVRYLVAVENLEKDLSPLTLREFIHRETIISAEAHIFPSLKTDLYTRGVIKVHSDEDFKNLINFMESSHHIIVSSRGRPLVISETEEFSGQDDDTSMGNLVPTWLSQHCEDAGINSQLKVVVSGTEDYNLARQFKEDFKEFYTHHKRLLKRLAANNYKWRN